MDAAKELLQYGLKGTDLEALIAIGKGVDDGRLVWKICTCCRSDKEKAEAAALGQADVEHIVEAVVLDWYLLSYLSVIYNCRQWFDAEAYWVFSG